MITPRNSEKMTLLFPDLASISYSFLLTVIIGFHPMRFLIKRPIFQGESQMKFLAVLASSFILGSAMAALKDAPPAFSYKDARAVYVDFETAKYDIKFDFATKKAFVESTISFNSPSEGYPIFDLVPAPLSASINGKAVSAPEIQDPERASTVRVVDARVSSGRHTLKLRHELSTNVVFGDDGVAAGFWTSDLNDRR